MNFNKEPIKKWFGFSRRERRSAFILLIILLVIIVLRYRVPENNTEIKYLSTGFTGLESASAINPGTDHFAGQPFKFDPNTASFNTFVKLGFTFREANTLINYRDKGGKFRQPADIKKVYGIDVMRAGHLMPFVEVKTDSIKNKRLFSSGKQKSLIDLNGCDTAQLVTLPGIGPVLSRRIINYRKLLGGFVSVSQLKEVYGLPAETFELIKGRVAADSLSVVRIKINSVGYKELLWFPYFQKYEVTAILKYRELKGRIESINDLTGNKLIPLEKANKVRPYLNFE
jgi:competence protein ComEA